MRALSISTKQSVDIRSGTKLISTTIFEGAPLLLFHHSHIASMDRRSCNPDTSIVATSTIIVIFIFACEIWKHHCYEVLDLGISFQGSRCLDLLIA